MDNSISFIIPHKGRVDFLRMTIESIAKQDFDLSRIEILIITQSPDISIDSIGCPHDLAVDVHSRPDSWTISRLRNYGVELSRGKYLAFLDADVYLSPNWVNCMIETLGEDPSRVLVSAVQINGDNAPPLERIRTALSNGVIDANVRFLPGRNLFLSRETFDRSGGFPEHLITCEDYYFTDMVGRQGQLYYTSAANYVHLGEDKVYGEMYRKEIWRGQSNLLSLKGRRIPLQEIPSFIVPIGILTMLLISVLLLLFGYSTLAFAAFLISLVPFMLYSLRLYRIASGNVSFLDIIKFYTCYFPARAIGTLGGIFKAFDVRDHK